MKKIFNRLWLLPLFVLLINSSWAAVSQDQLTKLSPQQAFDNGKLLALQYKLDDSKRYLKYAADNGHRTASLMYAFQSRDNLFIQTEEQYKYLVKSAELGSPWGMLNAEKSISPNTGKTINWYQKGRNIFLKEADHGNGFAMYMLASNSPTQDEKFDWLKRSADAGFPAGQSRLAGQYKSGKGWFLIPGSREKEIRRLYKASADQGYIPAMMEYAQILENEGKPLQALDIWKQTVEKGYSFGIIVLTDVYSGDIEALKDKKDDMKAAAYLKVYIDSMSDAGNNETLYYNSKTKYDQLVTTMTNEQKAESDRLAKEYLKTHTVRAFDDFWYLSEEDSVIKP